MKKTIKAYLIWTMHSWMKEPEIAFWPGDVSSSGPEHVLLKEMDIEVDLPDDFDPTPHQIKMLKAKKKQILAEAHVKAENIEEQIQRLLCIEYKPEVEV